MTRARTKARAPRSPFPILIALITAACAPLASPPEVPPPWTAPEPALPPIPFRDGPLALRLVYPPEGGQVTVRDTTFVFGAAGTGRARVHVNGEPVPVHPNGAFLAFLPVPPDGVYRVEATAGDDRAELVRPVRIPAPLPVPAPGKALIVESTVAPRGAWAALPGELIEVGFTGTAGGRAALLLPDGTRVPLVETGPVVDMPAGRRVFGPTSPDPIAPAPGLARYRGSFPARPLAAASSAVPRPALGPLADAPAPGPASVELVVGAATARAPMALNLALLDPARPPAGLAVEPEPYPPSAGGVHAATGPGYTYHYFWDSGTELTLTGQRAGHYRAALAPGVHAWVEAGRVRLLPDGTPGLTGGDAVGPVRLTPRPDAVEVRLALARRLPYRIDPRGRSVDITIYGATGDTRWLMTGGLDPHLIGARWSQPADGVYVLTLELAAPHWGHTAAWEPGGDLLVRIRRPPPVSRWRPLRGLTVAVDPGHPPGGATGPTGLTEAEVNLAVARRLARHLERAGARVVMTRTDERPVGLYERAHRAESAGAHLFVSLHQNAFPDGVDPFTQAGTYTFYFHPHAEALARTLQTELVAAFRLRDRGVARSSLAVVRRVTWMPAVLTETMFMMVPEQEAALRDPAVQERIARAHLRALERFLRAPR